MRRFSPRFTAAAIAAAATTAVTVGFLADTALAAPSNTTGTTAKAHPTKTSAQLPPDATAQQVQAAATTAINARIGALNDAAGKVQKAADLGGDQAALLHTLQGDVAGLQHLGQKIAADTTAPTARADYEQIFANFRVYALVLPGNRLVGSIDHTDNTIDPRLTTVAGKISARVTPADQAQVQPLLADLAIQVSASKSATAGLTPALEGYTPAQWNANHHLLTDAKGKVRSARGAVIKARADAKQAASDVRANRGAKHARTHGTGTKPA
ncbi:MAG: hypothetical protein ACRDXE_11025, partial [Acidimicrobiales bacterium]